MVVVIYERISPPSMLGTIEPPGVEIPRMSGDGLRLDYWADPDDETFVGLADSAGSFTTLDAAGLLARAESIHARYPITDPSTGDPYTDAALEQAVTDWITAAGA
jgi:hypothetical protein